MQQKAEPRDGEKWFPTVSFELWHQTSPIISPILDFKCPRSLQVLFYLLEMCFLSFTMERILNDLLFHIRKSPVLSQNAFRDEDSSASWYFFQAYFVLASPSHSKGGIKGQQREERESDRCED
jgi:hypothetical protein